MVQARDSLEQVRLYGTDDDRYAVIDDPWAIGVPPRSHDNPLVILFPLVLPVCASTRISVIPVTRSTVTYLEKLPYPVWIRRVRIGVETTTHAFHAAMIISQFARYTIVAMVIPVISRVADTPVTIDPEDTDISEIEYLGSLSKNGTESLDSTPVYADP